MLSLAFFKNDSTEENQDKEQYFFPAFISCIATSAGYNLFCEGRKLVFALLREQRICVDFVAIPIQRAAHLLDKYHLKYRIHT